MKKYLYILFASLGLLISCDEDVVIYDTENGQTLATFSTTSINLGVPVEGASVEVDVNVTTKTDSDRNIVVDVDPASTASSDQYTISNLVIPAGTFVGTLVIVANFEALPEEGATSLVLNLTDVSGSNDITLSNSTLTVSLFRECDSAPTPGVWTINMADSYDDGWQTTGPNGGPGLTCTLSTGEVFEVGLCTPYEANTYDCVDERSAGSDTITIPEGVESAEWFFPGDYWTEISFEIVAPNGNVVASYGPGSPAGPVVIDFCAQ